MVSFLRETGTDGSYSMKCSLEDVNVICNEEKTVQIKAGEGFMQGIFVEYGITVDDAATDVRNGGFGSTTK